MRNESRRVWSLQVEEGGIVQEVLRKQAGFSKKEISRAKFLPDGIRKNGTRCRVTEKTLPGDIIEILLETETQTSAHLAVNTEVLVFVKNIRRGNRIINLQINLRVKLDIE